MLTWHLVATSPPRPSRTPTPRSRVPRRSGREWSGRCTYQGEYRDAVLTSLIALKAMTNEATGARRRGADHVAAGGHRRRAQLGLPLLLAARLGPHAGRAARAAATREEALAFRDFVLRAATGDPATLQIMYGVGGERRLTEFELPRAARVRGLAAGTDRQRRVRAVPARRLRRGGRRRRARGPSSSASRPAELWPRWMRGHRPRRARPGSEPDDGIWEARGPRRGTSPTPR